MSCLPHSAAGYEGLLGPEWVDDFRPTSARKFDTLSVAPCEPTVLPSAEFIGFAVFGCSKLPGASDVWEEEGRVARTTGGLLVRIEGLELKVEG